MTSMAKTFRDFLSLIQQYGEDEYLSIPKPVDPKFEATTLIRKLELEGKQPVVMFEHPLDLNGEPSKYPLCMNVFSTRKKLALALGLDANAYKMELPFALMERYQNRIPPVTIDRTEAVDKEVIFRGEEVDLSKFPIPTHHSLDGAPYILAGTMITKNRENGTYNLGMIRFHVANGNTLVVNAQPKHHSGMIIQQYKDAGEKTPFVIALGCHPAFYLGSCWEGKFGTNEYELAGGVMQEPVRLVPSETWGDKFMVPADAEIIIEGEVSPDELLQEGPLGEFTKYYKTICGGVVKPQYFPKCNITAVTTRKDAYFQSLFIGHSEHGLLGAIPKEAVIYERVSTVSPGLRAVHLTPGGTCRHVCYISLKQRTYGEAQDAIMAAFTGDWHIKFVVAVDEDVDIYNDTEVIWAISSRTQPSKDYFVIPNAMGGALDPTVDSDKPYTSKMGIDATKPFGEPFPEVCEVPLDLLENMRVEDYL